MNKNTAINIIDAMLLTINEPSERQIEAVDMAIEALRLNWIPCSERLPKEADKTVLISMPNGFINLGLYSEFSKTWYKGSMCAVGGADPIAWMPLPKPYKGGDTE